MSRSFFTVITEAVNDLTANGFDSQTRLARWLKEIRTAALREMIPEEKLQKTLGDSFRGIYKRFSEGQLVRQHPGISRFTIDKIKPKLRAELDRRIMASANLIRLNRQDAITATLRRFSGWATSIPAGGSSAVDKVDTKADVRKALASLPFKERRVLIDQGHKLSASLSEIVAKDSGAIAIMWRSNWRQAGYNYREDHKERDGLVYAVRGNWAIKAGLMRAGKPGFYDDITAVGEEPFCRCYARWIYSLRDLPADMLTKAGAGQLERVKIKG